MGSVLILGHGHLAQRVRTLAQARGHQLITVPENALRRDVSDPARFDHALHALQSIELGSLTAALLVDDQDDRNLELALALISLDARIPVVVSMFNEKVAPHLKAANPNVRILNPARIAAPVFAEALGAPLRHGIRYAPTPHRESRHVNHDDRLLRLLVLVFAGVVALATTYFRFAEHLSWLDALYFVVVTTATVGYGDISLLHSSPLSKIVGIALILASTVFIWMIFSLTIDRIIKKRVQLALGRRVHTQSDHVIVCGLGRLGHLVAEELLARNERVLVIEQNEDNGTLEHLRALGADVYIGDARSPRVLQESGVRRAKALYSLVANDFVNLEIGLNARSFDPDLRLVLRIFDESMARRIQEHLDIHLSYSMSAIADERFVESAIGPADSAR